MSRLEELIAELCPDGVEYKELKDILTIKNGRDYKEFGAGDIPVYGSGGIITYIDTYAYDKPSVLIPRKGSIDKLYYVDIPFWTVDTIFYTVIKSDIVIAKFVYYFLETQSIERLNTGGGVPSLTQAVLNKVKIPVPPLPVQEEIVRILDKFTGLTAELTAELAKRKQQYQYYRINLLQIEKNDIRTIGDVCKFQNGFAFKSNLFKEEGKPILRIVNIKNDRIILDNVVFFNLSDYRENLEQFIVRNGDFVVAMSGATTGKVGINYTGRELFLNQRVGMFIAYENIIHRRYLYHFLVAHSEAIYQMASGSGAQPNLSSETLKKMKIPVPPLEEQERIVAILDRFDTLCNDLTSGLPAEIEARKKQYKYYRDKLLTFKEAV